MGRIRLSIFLLALFVLLGATGLGHAQGDMYVYFLDVGQAESTLLLGPGFTILIDAGDWGKSDVIDHLQRLGVEKVDLFIVTHPHADHIGQAAAVLDSFSVAEVWMSGFEHTTLLFEKLLDALLEGEADYIEPRTGEWVSYGELRLEVVNPADIGTNLHASNIVVRAVYGNVAFLFTGDAERPSERDMIGTDLPLGAQILQLGHHGSRTSSSLEFLLAVRPELAIYSAGLDGPFGHPHQEVIDRLKILGIPVYGTEINGTIIARTDGHTYTIYAESGQDLVPTMRPSLQHLEEERRVELNSASYAELQRIRHIGPARAQEIINLREILPFRSVDDLKWVAGLGAQKIEEIKEQGLAYVKGVSKD